MTSIAIIGKPNVGKSTLFNRILNKRISIESKTKGTTRDRISMLLSLNESNVNLIDTGGLTSDSEIEFQKNINTVVRKTIEESNIIIFVLSCIDGITVEDIEINNLLKKVDTANKKIIPIINKVDNYDLVNDIISDYYKLGLDNPITISSIHNLGINDLVDELERNINDDVNKVERKFKKIAIIGRPNAGKSTFINKILNKDERIVSDLPGTTRDIGEVIVKYEENDYLFVDSPGIKRKERKLKDLDWYSNQRTKEVIYEGDLILFFVDYKSDNSFTKLDKKIVKEIKTKYKSVILVINKSDLISLEEKKRIKDNIKISFPFFESIEHIFLSSKTGKNINKLFVLIDSIISKLNLKINIKSLNDFLNDMNFLKPPKASNGRRVKMKYINHINSSYHTFIVFGKNVEQIGSDYKRFLEKKIIGNFNLNSISIKIKFVNG